jgi:hypothetical protein
MTEEIVDEVNTPSKGRCDPKKIFKNVYHNKFERTLGFAPTVAVLQHQSTCTKYVVNVDSEWWWSCRPLPMHVPNLTHEELLMEPIGLYQAILRLEPSFETYLEGVNLWSIILELGQLKNLLGILVMNSKNHLENVAEKHLQYSFGVVPVVSDLKKIYNIMEKLDGVIDKWNALSHKGEILDFHETVSSSHVELFGEPGLSVTSPVSSSGVVYNTYDYIGSSQSKVHCYGYAKRIPDSQRFKVMIRALGLDRPISGAWEAVPFSWVVDYFTNIGDLIKAWEFKMDSMFRLHVTSAGYSTKVDYKAQVRVRDIAEGPYHGHIMTSYAEEAGSIFRRQRLPHKGLFNTARVRVNNSMRTGMFLGWKQGSYLAAVAYLTTRR